MLRVGLSLLLLSGCASKVDGSLNLRTSGSIETHSTPETNAREDLGKMRGVSAGRIIGGPLSALAFLIRSERQPCRNLSRVVGYDLPVTEIELEKIKLRGLKRCASYIEQNGLVVNSNNDSPTRK